MGWAVYGWNHQAPEFKKSHYYKVVDQLVCAGAIVDWEWIDNPNRGLSLGAKLRGDSRMMAALGIEK